MNTTKTEISLEHIMDLSKDTIITYELFYVDKTIDSITASFSQLTASIKTFTNELINKLNPLNLTINSWYFKDAFEKYDYSSLAYITVCIPPGLNIYVADYTKVLDSNIGFLSDITSKLLDPTINWLNEFIRTPETISSIRDLRLDVGLVKLNSPEIKKDIAKCFVADDLVNVVPFKKAAKNIESYIAAFELAKKLAEYVGALEHKSILSKVDAIYDQVDILADKIRLKDSRYNFDSKKMNQIIEIITHIADCVQLYSGLINYIGVLVESFKDTYNKVSKIK